MTMSMTTTEAIRLAKEVTGDTIVIPVGLVRKLDDLSSAAFYQAAASLSVQDIEAGGEGWFHLPAEGKPDGTSVSRTQRLGSWKAMLGISRDTVRRIRVSLTARGLMAEIRKGIPARMYYRVDPVIYLLFLAADDGNDIPDQDKSATKPQLDDFSGQSARSASSGSRGPLHPDGERTGNYKNNNKTTKHTPPATGGCADDIPVPQALRGAARDRARRMLLRAQPDDRQAIVGQVDQMARQGTLKKDPISLLAALVRESAAGTYIPLDMIAVAADGVDAQRRRTVARRREIMAEISGLEGLAATASPQTAASLERQLTHLRTELRGLAD